MKLRDKIINIPNRLYDHIYINGSIIYINENQQTIPLMKSFIDDLITDDPDMKIEYLSYELIQEYRSVASVDSSHSTKTVEMQEMAKKLFMDASNNNATDIHIDVKETSTLISMRIRRRMTVMREWEMPRNKGTSLVSAIYRLAQEGEADTDINIRANQDGRVSNRNFLPPSITSLRLARGPQDGGHFMVIRLLNDDATMEAKSLRSRLKYLGYHESQIRGFEYTRQLPSGMVLIGGTTGSGKSTTLKHVLESLHQDKPHLCIMSVEEPAEYVINGVRQISVTGNETEADRRKAFVDSIRLALRSDPDVILIGEIRDYESAHLAIRAAMTGHLVFATIHANNGFNILTRLIDQLTTAENPRPDKLVADPSLLLGLAYQRLIETLCPYCKKSFFDFKNTLPNDLMQRVESVITSADTNVSVMGDGCEKCNMTGIGGVTVLSEFILTETDLLDVVREKGVPEARAFWLDQHHENREIQSIRQHAIHKVLAGIIDPRDAESAVGLLTTETLAKFNSDTEAV
ncbi:MAG: ATPase, T2SS/T4P/T4SS family [Sedimenticola sp.]